MPKWLTAFVAWWVLCSPQVIVGQQAASQPQDQLAAARKTGWQLVQLVAGSLNGGAEFPGIEAWRKELAEQTKGIEGGVPPEKWPPVDMDALVTTNPNFWRAYYEIAPGDPGAMMLHAGLLLTAGEASRASQLAVLALQRPGVPKQIRSVLGIIVNSDKFAGERSSALVREGITLFDKGDYPAALKKHEAALAAWPQHGLAHYEFGLTLRQKQWKDAGEPLPGNKTVIVNSGQKFSPEVVAAFAKARKHDPFQLKAYQGDDAGVIAGFMALGEKGLPAWEQITKSLPDPAPDDAIRKLAEACQEANQHELALVARQILVARRNRFDATDHPFISKSLRAVAPGKPTEAALERLAGGRLSFRQLIAPE